MKRRLKGKGEVDYDYAHDILHFKVKDRDYWKSLELENLVVDLDKERYVVGLQIFDASAFLSSKTLRVTKMMLRDVTGWTLDAEITEDGNLILKLNFNVKLRNKTISCSPSLVRQLTEHLPASASEAVCLAAS